MSLLNSIATHDALHPPRMAGSVRMPSMALKGAALADLPQQGGMSGFLDRLTGSPLSQIGMALLAGGGGPLANSMAMLMQQGAYGRLARQQMAMMYQPRAEHIGNQIGMLNPMTGEFNPTYTEPANDENTQLIRNAGFDPSSPEGKKVYQRLLQNREDPEVQIPLPNGAGTYVGPRSGFETTVQGMAAPQPSAPPSPSPSPAPGAPLPRGLRNNNPLNITVSPFTEAQPGFTGADAGGRYATFDNANDGIAAAHTLLRSYAARGFNTPASIIGRWAPSSENGSATVNYANFVARRLGIGPNDVVPSSRYGDLVGAMSDFENGRTETPRSGQSDIISEAQRAIAAGADPEKVRARAAQMGVTLP